jgi:phosphoribosyl 1,2-cyclic phosphodiesterase
MKLKVLGSGSSGNCYLLQSSEGETLIVECGVDIKEIKKALNFSFKNVVGCLVTHEHKDHSKEALRLAMLGIKLFTSAGTLQEINPGAGILKSKILADRGFYRIGNFTVCPFDTKHDAREPLGFLITHIECGTILFATDTYYIPYTFEDFDIHHVMIECNYSKEILKANNQLAKLKDRIMQSHFELEDVKEFFKANGFMELRDVVLLHLSNANSDAEQFKGEIETLVKKPVYVADKGLEIDFDLYEF